jgi:hypothetical protein
MSLATLTSRSKVRVIELLTPPTAQTGLVRDAPRGLTIRALMHHRRHHRLRTTYTIARLNDGTLVPLSQIAVPGRKFYYTKEAPPLRQTTDS